MFTYLKITKQSLHNVCIQKKIVLLERKTYTQSLNNNLETILLYTNKVILSKDHLLNPSILQKGFLNFLSDTKSSKHSIEKILSSNERDIIKEVDKIMQSSDFHTKFIKLDFHIEKALTLNNDYNLMRLAIIRNYVKLFHKNAISMLDILKDINITKVFNLYEMNFIIFLIFTLNFSINYPLIDEMINTLVSKNIDIKEALDCKLSNSFINLVIENLYELSDPKKINSEICLKFYQKFFLSLFPNEAKSMEILKNDEITIKIMQILYSLNTYTSIDKNLLICMKNREIEQIDRQNKIKIDDAIKKLKFYSRFIVDSDNKLADYYSKVLQELLETNNSISGKLLLTNIINLGKQSFKSNKSIMIISKLFVSSFKDAYRIPKSSLSINEQSIKDYYIEDYSHYFSNLQYFSNIKIDDTLELIQSLVNINIKDFELLKISENLIIDHIEYIDNFKQLLKILIFYLDFNVGSDIFYFFLLKRFLEMMNSFRKDQNEVYLYKFSMKLFSIVLFDFFRLIFKRKMILS